jgi:predicted anti-sigma-YlaC factor YlaD
VSGCDRIRELLAAAVDAPLASGEARRVEEHLDRCDDCRSWAEDLRAWRDDLVAAGDGLEPPDGLGAAIASSPCHRWLSLLFEAVDHRISDANLERLLGHLDRCPDCRGAWTDLTLLHQTGEILEPADHLTAACVAAPWRKRRTVRLLERRTVVAAAYILAVTASLVVGNPVLIARTSPPETVEQVAAEVATDGRGEARVMLWRVWQAATRGAAAVHDLLEPILPDRDDEAQNAENSTDQGASDDS